MVKPDFAILKNLLICEINMNSLLFEISSLQLMFGPRPSENLTLGFDMFFVCGYKKKFSLSGCRKNFPILLCVIKPEQPELSTHFFFKIL